MSSNGPADGRASAVAALSFRTLRLRLSTSSCAIRSAVSSSVNLLSESMNATAAVIASSLVSSTPTLSFRATSTKRARKRGL